MAMRKMRKGKSDTKPLQAKTATYMPTAKRPAKEDSPGHLRGGKQPVKTPKSTKPQPKGVMSIKAKKLRGVMI